MGEENLNALGFDPRILQPVATSYTDCAIPTSINKTDNNLIHNTKECIRITCLYLLQIVFRGVLHQTRKYKTEVNCQSD